MGAIPILAGSATASLYKLSNAPVLYAHQQQLHEEITTTNLKPAVVDLGVISLGVPRAVARVSSTARELLWYCMRVMDELRAAWLGTETQAGARMLGRKWLAALDNLQQLVSGEHLCLSPYHLALTTLNCVQGIGRPGRWLI